MKPVKIECDNMCFLFEPYYIGKGTIKDKRQFVSINYPCNPYLSNKIKFIIRNTGNTHLEMKRCVIVYDEFIDENEYRIVKPVL